MLENEILRRKYENFKIFFFEKKKKFIKTFFRNLMNLIGELYEKFKSNIKMNENIFLQQKKNFEETFHLKYPWTISQINLAFVYFEKI